MFDNPYCHCGRHLGLQYHRSEDHELAQAEMDEAEVSALQISNDTVRTAASWCGGHEVVEHDAFDHSKTFPAVNVLTKRGVQRASEGDWIIQQEDGSFEVMGPADYQRSRAS